MAPFQVGMDGLACVTDKCRIAVHVSERWSRAEDRLKHFPSEHVAVDILDSQSPSDGGRLLTSNMSSAIRGGVWETLGFVRKTTDNRNSFQLTFPPS